MILIKVLYSCVLWKQYTVDRMWSRRNVASTKWRTVPISTKNKQQQTENRIILLKKMIFFSVTLVWSRKTIRVCGARNWRLKTTEPLRSPFHIMNCAQVSQPAEHSPARGPIAATWFPRWLCNDHESMSCACYLQSSFYQSWRSKGFHLIDYFLFSPSCLHRWKFGRRGVKS